MKSLSNFLSHFTFNHEFYHVPNKMRKNDAVCGARILENIEFDKIR